MLVLAQRGVGVVALTSSAILGTVGENTAPYAKTLKYTEEGKRWYYS